MAMVINGLGEALTALIKSMSDLWGWLVTPIAVFGGVTPIALISGSLLLIVGIIVVKELIF